MILQITLKHSFLGGESSEVLYIGPEELEAGADIASHFSEDLRALFSPFTAKYVDDETLEITWGDKRCRYSECDDCVFNTEWLTLYKKTVTIEGDESTNEHEVKAFVRLVPHIESTWDLLKVTRENEIAVFRREHLKFGVDLDDEARWGKRYDWLKKIWVLHVRTSSLTLRFTELNDRDITLDCHDASEVEVNGSIFSLVSQSVIINEWDMMESKPLSIHVPKQYLKESETDRDTAYLLAECVQEQYPEALEVIADYMRKAYELGSTDAEEWLKDYHSDDGRYDAYC